MEDTAAEFQRRRADTWSISRPWLLLAALSFTVDVLAGRFDLLSSSEDRIFGQISLAVFGASILRLIFVLRTRYLCPACGAMPMTGGSSAPFWYRRGVDLDPETCSNCGAKLK